MRITGVAIAVMGFLAAAAPASADFYVTPTGGGSFDGSSWADAFGSLQAAVNAMSLTTSSSTLASYTVQVAETSIGEYYAPVSATGTLTPFSITFAGGYDPLTGLQTGISALQGSGLTSGEGLRFQPGAHGKSMAVAVSNFSISNVAVGIKLDSNAGWDSIRPSITLSNSTITSGSHGLQVDWPKSYQGQGPTTINVTNSTITAGQDSGAAAGDAINSNGPLPQFAITGSTLTSAKGGGINVRVSCDGGGSSGSPLSIALTDSQIVNTAGDAIHFEDLVTASYYDRYLKITLERSTISGSAGHGVFALTRSTNWSGSGGDGRIQLQATNSVIADNAADGVHLEGYSAAANSGRVDVTVVNSTIVGNGGDGIDTFTQKTAGGAHVIRNSIIANNGGAGVTAVDGDSAGMTVTEGYNNFYNNAGGAVLPNGSAVALAGTDKVTNPLFLGSGPHPYQLTASSPGLNTASAGFSPFLDRLGNMRGSSPDMGAYELGASAPPAFTKGTVYVDFAYTAAGSGDASTQDSSRRWHVVAAGGTVTELRSDEEGRPLGSLTVGGGFADNGWASPGASSWTGTIPWAVDAMTGDFLSSQGTGVRTVTLSGLDADYVYTVELVAARFVNNTNRHGHYYVIDAGGSHESDNLRSPGVPYSLNFDTYADGASNKVLLTYSNLTPDSNGQILINAAAIDANNFIYFTGLKLTVAPVPEPATLAFLALGGLAMAGRVLRKSRKA